MARHRPPAWSVSAQAVGSLLIDGQGNAFEMRSMSCPTCRQSSVRVLGERGGRHHRYRLGIETRIVRCVTCGLIFPDPFPFAVDPQRLYGDPDKYFEAHDESEKLANCRQLIRETARRLGKAAFRFVDVGSGRGELLRAAQLEGAIGLGIDFSSAMIDHARRRHGVEIQQMTIEQLARERLGQADVVFLVAVLEHVYDPDAMVAAAAELCRPGGLLYVDVPNEPHLLSRVGNAWNRLCGSNAVYNLSPSWPPYHVFGFNRRALSILLEKHGFAVTEVKIFAAPRIPAASRLGDAIRSWVGTQINRVANLTGTASNMYVWAERLSDKTRQPQVIAPR